MYRTRRRAWLTLGAGAVLLAACTAGGEATPIATSASGEVGKDIFAGPQGSDSAAGTEEDPVATIEAALTLAAPRDRVVLLPGIHPGGHQLENVASITITGRPGAVLDGAGQAPLGLFCDGCRNIVFENLEVTGYTDVGIGATNSTGVVLQGLSVHDNGFAVQLVDWELEGYGIHVDFSSNVVIQNNSVSGNGPNPPVFPERLLGTGINTFGNSNVVIADNNSFRNHGGGILVEDSSQVVVERNNVYENDLDASVDQWWDGGLWVDGGRDIVIANNTFRDNLGPGIEISDEEGQDPGGYVLEDNVSTGNYWGIFIWGFGTDDWPDESVLTRSGNTLTGNDRGDAWIVADF